MAKQYTTPTIDVVEQSGGQNTRLPYGLAKGRGLDTTGKTPREVWKMLKGEGIDPKKEYEKLKERGEKNKATQESKSGTVKNQKEVKDWGKKNNVSFDGLYNGLPEEKANEQANRFVELYEQFPVAPKSGNEVTVGVGTMNSRGAIAEARYNLAQSRIGIVFSTQFSGIGEKEVERNIKEGWWSDTAPENYKYQTLNHEYGHAIEYSILSRLGYEDTVEEKTKEFLERARYDWRFAVNYQKEVKKIRLAVMKEMFYDKVIPEIFRRAKEYDSTLVVPKRITKEGFKTAPNISTYGGYSWAEYFAESFANGVGGNPTAIGRATVEVVKDIYGGKFL